MDTEREIIRHHTSYIPQKIILICGICHKKLHLKSNIKKPKGFIYPHYNTKTIIVEDDLWLYLSKRKLDLKLKTLNDVINNLRENVERLERSI